MSKEHFDLLTKIGMVWDNRLDVKWENGMRHLQEYILSNGDADVKAGFICEDGFALGDWLNRQRRALRTQSSNLSVERRQQLLRTLPTCGERQQP